MKDLIIEDYGVNLAGETHDALLDVGEAFNAIDRTLPSALASVIRAFDIAEIATEDDHLSLSDKRLREIVDHIEAMRERVEKLSEYLDYASSKIDKFEELVDKSISFAVNPHDTVFPPYIPDPDDDDKPLDF